jgi:hypothetical protein
MSTAVAAAPAPPEPAIVEHKIRQVRHLAAKPRTPLRSARLPTLAKLPGAAGAAGAAVDGGLPSWRNEDIEAALRRTSMHVGQALLVLQDPTYRPGSVRQRLTSPRAGGRRGSSPRAGAGLRPIAPAAPRPAGGTPRQFTPCSARSDGVGFGSGPSRFASPRSDLRSRGDARTPRSGQLLRVAGRVHGRSARKATLDAQLPLRHLPRYAIPVPVHDAIASGDWPSTSKWLRDREATIVLGHPPLLATPGDLHVQHPNLVGNDLRGDHYDPGTSASPPLPVMCLART